MVSLSASYAIGFAQILPLPDTTATVTAAVMGRSGQGGQLFVVKVVFQDAQVVVVLLGMSAAGLLFHAPSIAGGNKLRVG